MSDNTQLRRAIQRATGKKVSVWARKDEGCWYESACELDGRCEQGYFWGYAESIADARNEALSRVLAQVDPDAHTRLCC